jgi:hypothetical protein
VSGAGAPRRGRRRALAALSAGLLGAAGCRDRTPTVPVPREPPLPLPGDPPPRPPRTTAAPHPTARVREPVPPVPVAREVPIEGEVAVPQRFIGMHFHRWPHGSSPAPGFRFGTVRSLNYDPLDNGLGVHWAAIHKAPDEFDWRILDRWVATHSGAGRDLMYTLYGTPAWASTRPDRPDLYGLGGGNSRPRDPAALDRFVRALVARYNGDGTRRLRYLEIWNEPDFPSDYWIDSPADLAALARVAYTAAKAVDPSLVVVWPGFVNWIMPDEKIPRIHRLYLRLAQASDGAGGRGADWGDALAFHYYATRADAGQFVDHQQSVRATRDAIGRSGWDIHLTEIGFEDKFGETLPVAAKLRLIRQWIAISAAFGDRFVGLYSYENANNLAAPAFDKAAAHAIDEMHDALCGRNLRRAALLADGSVWLLRDDGEVLRY